MELQPLNYQKDRELKCEYKGHLFHLQRDPEDKKTFGYWWASVMTEQGNVCLEEWIDDSSNLTATRALLSACSSLSINLTPEEAGRILALDIEHNHATLSTLKSLDGKDTSMLSIYEKNVLTFYINQGRKYNTSISIISEAPQSELAQARSTAQYNEILSRHPNRISITGSQDTGQ